MTNRASFAVVVERDTAQRAAWSQLLERSGLRRVLRRARPAEARDLMTPGAPLTAMLVGLTAHLARDDDMLGLIAEARRLVPDAVILAVDHGNRPRGAAEIFAAGADDALRADHDPSELRARLSVRLQGASLAGQRAARLVQLGLTPLEERILGCLNARRGQIVSRPALAAEVAGAEWSYGDRRFDVHIGRIRKKLEEAYGPALQVRTIRAQGYVLEGDAPL
ncbi:response regulator transcription factor [Yangia mangrovi]|uniref:Response regulator transcription factor n=1 Tax=Alloyangia mangrovi TaxID=1779329 RepID=A0ABT2KGI1_9RHOB|nr:winged helix-turn-helix domain-containing protein [Alloyangia mangrovi]MCT4369475.1 response regulator transcription factor [Alloyangia mangrovi]